MVCVDFARLEAIRARIAACDRAPTRADPTSHGAYDDLARHALSDLRYLLQAIDLFRRPDRTTP